MQAGFYTIMAAQFFSSLADNALLIAAIALLRELHEPAWMTPALKQSFVEMGTLPSKPDDVAMFTTQFVPVKFSTD